MVATSQPLATQAGLRALERGGNAIDAALAAAAVLCVVEPMSTGVGGDCFALVWRDGELTGLNASGRAPAAADPDAMGTADAAARPAERDGARAPWPAGRRWPSATGASASTARSRTRSTSPSAASPSRPSSPATGRRRPTPSRASRRRAACSCRRRASARSRGRPSSRRRCGGSPSEGAGGLYRGPVGEAICAVTPLTLDDLAVPHADWVEPLRRHYRGVDVCEIPPNGQGVAALQALGILDGLEHTAGSPLDRVHLQAEAMKLAFADAERYVHDGPLPARYLDEDYLASRRALIDAAHAGAPVCGRACSPAAPSTCARSTRIATRAR